jgi:triosephosphate isomerase
MKVIACIGELESERDANETEAVLARQLAPIVSEIGVHERLVIAYEPVWAIGTGKTASPAQAEEAHAFIRSIIDVPILYGGSVKPDNAGELMGQPNVNGALVGGASLDVDTFVALCAAAAVVA